MRFVLTFAAVSLTATAAFAQSTTSWVPTGIDVPGPVHYELENGRVVTLPNDKRRWPIEKIVESFSDPTKSGAEAGADTDGDGVGE